MSAAATQVTITTGTTDTLAEALRLIRTVHPGADESTVKVVDGDDTLEGPRVAANLMISSLGVGAILRCTNEGGTSGVKRTAPTVRVHYAFYAAPQ